MSIPFHSVSIAAYTQILPGVCATLDKGRAFFDEHGLDPDDVLAFALAEDMKPFHFQVRSVVHHSLGAIEGLRTGHFAPPTPDPLYSWNGLRDRVADALARISAVTSEELDQLSQRNVLFATGVGCSRRRSSCCPGRCPTCTSTQPRPTTCCG